ncbi:transposase [Falsiroseomonas stagni DSM 19981]|uniref:Transposase n=1 Tax=Falsiroseomonas stagni DSM 19981 TaxID=1123062 RepID=A0A1I4FCT4_9PROT|nr:transposase [Falsiroseomonas stagni DSM 19981]
MPDGQRGEVISLVQRRRRWTTEQKLALVEEAMRPGSSVAGVADRHGMSRSLLFEWRRQVREGTMPGVVRMDRQVPPTLVPVRVVADPPRPQPTVSACSDGSVRSVTTVEVVLRNGRVLRVAEAIPPEVLGRLAAALDA